MKSPTGIWGGSTERTGICGARAEGGRNLELVGDGLGVITTEMSVRPGEARVEDRWVDAVPRQEGYSLLWFAG